MTSRVLSTEVEVGDFDVDNQIRPNRLYFVTGQNNSTGDFLIKHICFYLMLAGVGQINCFCPKEKVSFYSSFIPPAMICDNFTEQSLTDLFSAQAQNMAFAEENGKDPKERQSLKQHFSRILIFDRAEHYESQGKGVRKFEKWPSLNNGLMNAARNQITVIYRNIDNFEWKSKLPPSIISIEDTLCFIVSSLIERHAKEAYSAFGQKLLKPLKFEKFMSLLHDDKGVREGVAMVISRSASELKAVEEAGKPEKRGLAKFSLKQSWSEYFTKISVPIGPLKTYKFGDKELWENYVLTDESVSEPVESSASVTSSLKGKVPEKKRFDTGILDMLNLVNPEYQLQIGVKRKKTTQKVEN